MMTSILLRAQLTMCTGNSTCDKVESHNYLIAISSNLFISSLAESACIFHVSYGTNLDKNN
jgi:hypothetical protein